MFYFLTQCTAHKSECIYIETMIQIWDLFQTLNLSNLAKIFFLKSSRVNVNKQLYCNLVPISFYLSPSTLMEDFEEMFPWYYIDNNVSSKSSTTHWCVTTCHESVETGYTIMLVIQ